MRKKNQTQLTAVAGRKVRNQPLGYLFLLPVMASLTIFTFYPFFRSIYLTFFMADRLGNAKKFVGFGNYIRLKTDITDAQFKLQIQIASKG